MIKYFNIALLLLSALFSMQCLFLKVFPDTMRGEYFFENVISGTGKDKILVINVNGIISDNRKENLIGMQSDSVLSTINDQLKKASYDSNIKGIILKINSPGGTVTTSDIIYRQISRYRQFHNIPVHSLFMDTAASGAYYIAMATSHITAHPTTITGSIGVVLSGINVSDSLKKIGIQNQTIASGKNKTIGSPMAPVNPEQIIILQNIVDDLYNRFYTIVQKNRTTIPGDKLKALADGRIYTASQALENGLIDKIGYFEDAVTTLMNDPLYIKTENNQHPKIIIYSRNRVDQGSVYNSKSGAAPGLINQIIPGMELTGFLYLWQAGN